MASRQETADAEPQERTDGAGTTCSTQTVNSPGCGGGGAGKAWKCSFSVPESVEEALDTSSLPSPPSPENGSVNGASERHGASATGLRDGHCFLRLLQAETGRMDAWCQQIEQESKDRQLSEEVLGKIRSAVGSAQLLMSQKFQQFRGLCEQNLDASAQPRPTAQDLEGFWDLLQLSIEDISTKFTELLLLKANDWKQTENNSSSREEEQKPSSVSTPRKALKPKAAAAAAAAKERSSGDSAADKQRQEARRRLMAAKRAASERQNSATESADSIEIYVPEAQTRL